MEQAKSKKLYTWKFVTLFTLPILAGIIFHASFASILNLGIQDRWWLLVLAIAAFCSVVSLGGIAAAISRDKTTLHVLPVLIALTAFILGFSISSVSGVVLMYIAFAHLFHSSRSETLSRTTFAITKSLSHATNSIILLLLAVSVLSYSGFQRHSERGTIVPALVNTAARGVDKALPLVYPKYHSDMTLDELIGSQIPSVKDVLGEIEQGNASTQEVAELKARLEEAGIDPKSLNLDEIAKKESNQQQRFIQELQNQLDRTRGEIIASTRQNLSESLRSSLQGNEKVPDLLRTILQERIEKIVDPYARYMALFLSASLFFTIIIFTGLYTLLVWLIAWFVFWSLKTTGFVKRVQETVPVIRYEL